MLRDYRVETPQFVGATIRVVEVSDGHPMVHQRVTVWTGSGVQHLCGGRINTYTGEIMNQCWATEDATQEVLQQVQQYLLEQAESEYRERLDEDRPAKGRRCEVIRGRKVPKGTILKVFWTGMRPTWKATQYEWCHDVEEIAGAITEAGEKVWIKTEYLQCLDAMPDIEAPAARKWIAQRAAEMFQAL